nr:unnamed protein product [Digitaria exilis]
MLYHGGLTQQVPASLEASRCAAVVRPPRGSMVAGATPQTPLQRPERALPQHCLADKWMRSLASSLWKELNWVADTWRIWRQVEFYPICGHPWRSGLAASSFTD